MENNPESIEQEKRLSSEERFNVMRNIFPEIIHFQGRVYDLREVNITKGNAMYRMISEARIHHEEPSYLEVDKDGFIVREWN